MKKYGVPGVGLLVLIGFTGTMASPDRTDRMVIKSIEDLDWIVEYPDRSDSPRIAIVSGDPATTPISMLIRMAPGALPMHHHTASYQAVVVSGSMKHWAQGETEANAPVLGPGSWWSQPGGEVHTDACVEPAGECMLYVHSDGPLDTILADASRASRK